MPDFRILLAIHAPIVETLVAMRLDTLLTECVARQHQDWASPFELPLVFDPDWRGYRASQIVYLATPQQPLVSQQVTCVSSAASLERDQVKNPPTRIKERGGGMIRRVTQRPALLPAYVAFHGQGEAQACAELLTLLDGIGSLHSLGYGEFSIVSVDDDPSTRWRYRSRPADQATDDLDCRTTRDYEPLMAYDTPEAVIRPHRILRATL
ncbi:hypothetical protein [Salinisphaera orenii]|uniref:hypothetical protein n=1 Tax=Salinisphaera orenii TaxID=856731 RepID=UPI000DBE41C0